MWILNIVPEVVVHMVVLLSILGIIVSLFLNSPSLILYKLPVKLISIGLLLASLYLEGGLAEKQAWDLKVKTLEAQLAEAKTKSANVNIEVIKKLLTNKAVTKEKGETVIKYVDREVTKYDNSCPVPQSVIIALNAAARNEALIQEDKVESKPINEAATKSTMKLPKK